MRNPYTQANDKIRGWPDHTLTILLLIIAAVAVIVAWRGDPVVKAGVTAWLLLP